MYLALTWKNESADGYTDLIPRSWLKSLPLIGTTHQYVTKRGKLKLAKCDVTRAKDGLTVIDYAPYPTFKSNDEWDPYALLVARAPAKTLPEITWTKPGKQGWTSRKGIGKIEWIDDLNYYLSTRSVARGREARLQRARPKPERKLAEIVLFERNPDVIAEVLSRAGGICKACNEPAPFKRASDGTPYLEVHHRVRLIDGGDDTVENAMAVCPNCHRRLHYG